MKREEWFEKKWHYLRRFGYFALGGVLVIETSGWSKIIYWFRHIFPDRARAARYANVE